MKSHRLRTLGVSWPIFDSFDLKWCIFSAKITKLDRLLVRKLQAISSQPEQRLAFSCKPLFLLLLFGSIAPFSAPDKIQSFSASNPLFSAGSHTCAAF